MCKFFTGDHEERINCMQLRSKSKIIPLKNVQWCVKMDYKTKPKLYSKGDKNQKVKLMHTKDKNTIKCTRPEDVENLHRKTPNILVVRQKSD